MIIARDLLPRETSYYRYMGSLTTTVDHNARPLQPVNNRLVLAPAMTR